MMNHAFNNSRVFHIRKYQDKFQHLLLKRFPMQNRLSEATQRTEITSEDIVTDLTKSLTPNYGCIS
jgi:hypothetical protein